jgi:hypothetical protein
MSLLEQYNRNKTKLLNDESICKPNRELFKKFFEEEEYKLKRKRKLEKLNDKVCKTLLGYVQKLRNTNTWFKNKDLTKITREDIKKVYDDLEEGRIKNIKGTSFKDKNSYYNKVFKSTLFQMIGKDEIAKEVIVATSQSAEEEDKEVRFITEEDFKRTISVVIQIRHKLALQLGWDTTENLSTILKLKVSDCKKVIDSETKEPEYNIRLRKEILKTSRTKRTEPTLYSETVQLLDLVIQGKEPEENIFDYDKPALEKVWKRAVEKTKIRCEPDGQIPTIKDIRSGSMCHLLNKGWTSDEIKSRAGHKPSSSVIDKYLNYKAKRKQTSKKKIRVFELDKLQEEIESMKQREKLLNKRNEEVQEENNLKEKEYLKMFEMIKKEIEELKKAKS